MNLIVAVAENWGIGHKNELLFRISNDLKNFRKITKDKVVVMGHNTFKSLPGSQPLKNRTNIVLSRDKGLSIPGVVVCNSLDELLVKTDKYNTCDVFVIGGEVIYTTLLNHCKKAYITKVKATVPADTFFPNVDEMEQWKLTEASEEMEQEGLKYTFCVYENMGK